MSPSLNNFSPNLARSQKVQGPRINRGKGKLFGVIHPPAFHSTDAGQWQLIHIHTTAKNSCLSFISQLGIIKIHDDILETSQSLDSQTFSDTNS